MSFLSLVEANKQAFMKRGLLAKANDAAKILDDPLFVGHLEKRHFLESLIDVGNYLQYLCTLCCIIAPQKFLKFTDRRMVFFPKALAFNPGKTARILIVDDEISAIIDTAKAFIGWPNLLVSYYYFESSKEASLDMQKALNDIIQIDPDIVLMDQDLDSIRGYVLVTELKKISDKFIFVCNTDAEDDSLMLEAGCLPNCGKGNFPEGFRQGLKLFKKRQ